MQTLVIEKQVCQELETTALWEIKQINNLIRYIEGKRKNGGTHGLGGEIHTRGIVTVKKMVHY